MKVLAFLNRISYTSIPFELSVRIARLPNTEIVVASFFDDCPTDVELEKDMRSLPVEVRYLGGSSKFDRNAWRSLQHELAQGYDLIHTHHNFSGSVARILARRQRVPIVNTEHRSHSSFSLIQNLVNAPTLPLADRVVSNSQATQKSFRWYEQLLIKKENKKVIYNGIDISKIKNVIEGTARSHQNDCFRICTVGRMVPVKNQSVLLQAFHSISQQQNVELILVGDGPLRDNLESLAINLGIDDKVQFTGKVPREHVYKIFAHSDIFVIPSLAEGFCVAAVEAMAAGLPVVASDIPVFREIIGECGIYADPEHINDFAKAIEYLLENKGHCKQKSEACQSHAHTKYSLDQCAKSYYELYKYIMNSSS